MRVKSVKLKILAKSKKRTDCAFDSNSIPILQNACRNGDNNAAQRYFNKTCVTSLIQEFLKPVVFGSVLHLQRGKRSGNSALRH